MPASKFTNFCLFSSERLGTSVETKAEYNSMKRDIESHRAIAIRIEVKETDLAVLLVTVSFA
jgi:hypothetical protein